ncbi:MAG: hypothetical protein HY747_10485 [Elusimicrobia bacterium]|nr:hypothetical protein [Elusimicrobiota bacterium]
MSKEQLLQFIRGHQKMNELTAQERARKLPLLTPTQSRRIYEELWSLWSGPLAQFQPLPAALNDRRLQLILQRRQILNKAARA